MHDLIMAKGGYAGPLNWYAIIISTPSCLIIPFISPHRILPSSFSKKKSLKTASLFVFFYPILTLTPRYKCALRGTDLSDEAHFTHEEKYLTLPNMLVVSTQDFATRADVQSGSAKEWMRGCRVERVDCGHWIPLEKPSELTALLVKFVEESTAGATV